MTALQVPLSPERCANELTKLLDTTKGTDRYPVDVAELTLEVSRQRYLNDRILGLKGEALRGFEGALAPVGTPRRGWVIIFDERALPGRRRFTVAHEAGHYFLHRHRLPADGVRCREEDVSRRSGKGIEKEADTFAATLLMPFHDMRRQIDAKAKPTLDDLNAAAERYGVSLTALTLRGLEYTERRSMLVVSRDGYALWSRSSTPALRSGRFIRTSGEPHEIPAQSPAARPEPSADAKTGIVHPPGTWFDEEVEELTVRSRNHDQAITVLHMSDRRPRWSEPDEDHVRDVFDRFVSR